MKKVIVTLIASWLVVHCANEESGAPCPAPTIDGSIKELAGSCRVSSEEEHLRLEGISISSSQKIEVWIKASDISGNNGIKITIDATHIAYQNLSDTSEMNMFNEAHRGLRNTMVCFDFHFEENPLHAIGWKGAECDTIKKGGSNIGMVIFNKEPNDRVTGNDVEGNKKYLYKITGASVTKIETKKSIFSE